MTLLVTENRLNGTLPSSWAVLPRVSHVTTLNASALALMTAVSKHPKAPQRTSALCTASLSYHVSADTPVTHVVMVQLWVLDVSANRLSGALPSSWGALSQASHARKLVKAMCSS